jgi:hypothetical protein
VTIYTIMKRLGLEVVVVTSPEFKRQTMTPGKLRKSYKCETCGKQMAKGDCAYRTIQHGMNRMHRVHATCLEEK